MDTRRQYTPSGGMILLASSSSTSEEKAGREGREEGSKRDVGQEPKVNAAALYVF